MVQKWRIRVLIPVPPACKAGALPLELIPHNSKWNFQIETHKFKFTKHVSDDRHPSSVVNTSEPLVGVI